VSPRPKAIIAHPLWGRGGAEAAAMWIIEALLQDFDVTVYTRGGFDLCALNEIAGLRLSPERIALRVANGANAWPLGALAHGAFLRSLEEVGSGFDLRVTASGVCHWGRSAIHFLSSVTWNDALAARFERRGDAGLARDALRRLSGAISQASKRSLRGDLFIANSRWTARQSAPFCPGPLEVVPPAVPLLKPGSSWAARENGVLVLGRLSPEKRIETCIEIVEGLRAKGKPLILHIVGPEGGRNYAARIDDLRQARSDWIECLPLVVGAAKQDLLGRFRYGLSACEIEAFGIATAEMAAAGMVVFAPEDGAQGEILEDPRQRYRSVADAVERLSAVLDNEPLQHELHTSALGARGRFAPPRFVEAVRALAKRFVGSSCASSSSIPAQQQA